MSAPPIEFRVITVLNQTDCQVYMFASIADLEDFGEKLRLSDSPPIFIIIIPYSKKSLSYLSGVNESQLYNVLKWTSLPDSKERKIVQLSIDEKIDEKNIKIESHKDETRIVYQFEQKYFRAMMKYPQNIKHYYRFVYFFNKNTKTFDDKLYITTFRAISSSELPLYGVAVPMSGDSGRIANADNDNNNSIINNNNNNPRHSWRFDEITCGQDKLIPFIQKKYADKCGNEELVRFKLNDTIISNLVPLSLHINYELEFTGNLVLDKNSLNRVCSSEQMFGEKNRSMKIKADYYRKCMQLLVVNEEMQFILLTKDAIYTAFSKVQTRPDILLTQMYNDKKVKQTNGNDIQNEVEYEFQMPVEIIYGNKLCKLVAVIKPRQYDNQCQVKTILTPRMALENLALNYPKLHKLRLTLSLYKYDYKCRDYLVGRQKRFLWAIMLFRNDFSFYQYISNNDYNSNAIITNEADNKDNNNNINSNNNDVDEKESTCGTATTSRQTTSNDTASNSTASNENKKNNIVIGNPGLSTNETDEKEIKSPVVVIQKGQETKDTKKSETSTISVARMMEIVSHKLRFAEKQLIISNNKDYGMFEYLENVIEILWDAANENVEQDFIFNFLTRKVEGCKVSLFTVEILSDEHRWNKALKWSSTYIVYTQICEATLRKYSDKYNIENVKEYIEQFEKMEIHCNDVGVKNGMINLLNTWKEIYKRKECISNNNYNSNAIINNEVISNDNNNKNNSNSNGNSNNNNVDEKESKCATATTNPQTTSDIVKTSMANDIASNSIAPNANEKNKVVVINSGLGINETYEKEIKSPLVVTQNEQDGQDTQDMKTPEKSRMSVWEIEDDVNNILDAEKKRINNKHSTIFEYLENVITKLCNAAKQNVEQDFQFEYIKSKTDSFVSCKILNKGNDEVNKKLKSSTSLNVFKEICGDILRKYGGESNVKNIKEHLSEFYKTHRNYNDVDGINNGIINVLNKCKKMNKRKECIDKKNKSKENK